MGSSRNLRRRRPTAALVALSILAVGGACNSRSGAQKTKAGTARSTTTIAAPDTVPAGACGLENSDDDKPNRWRITSTSLVTAPVIDGDTAFVGSNSANGTDGCIFAINATSGEVIWAVEGPISPGSVPISTRGVVIAAVVTTAGVDIVGFNPVTGGYTWRRKAIGKMLVQPPVLASGVLYVAAQEALIALDPGSGKVRWKVAKPPLALASGTAGTFVTFADAANTTSMLIPATGKAKWSTQLAPKVAKVYSVAKSVVMLLNDPNTLIGMDVATGKVLWTTNIAGSQNSPLTLVDDVAFFSANDGKAYRLEAKTGRIPWTMSIGTVLPTGPAIMQNKVVFPNSVGGPGLVAFDLLTGKQQWKVGIAAPVTSGPRVTGSYVAVGTNQGTVCRTNADGDEPNCSRLATGNVNRQLAFHGSVVIARVGTQTIAASPF
jgi:outer membrane protein assembly factor BamB